MNQDNYILTNLNMISRLALLENANETRESIDTLVAILRYMDLKFETMSTLSKELSMVAKIFYLFRQKKRKSFNGIILNNDIPEICYIPKGSIIEFVQVALNKKIEHKQGLLEVKVIPSFKNNEMEVIVQDNGQVDYNLEEEDLNGIYDNLIHKHKQKVKFISVEMKKGIGTKVILNIPVESNHQD